MLQAEAGAEAMVLDERAPPLLRHLERALDRRREQGRLIEDGAGGRVGGSKDVAEALLELGQRGGRRIDWDRLAHGAIERAHLVDAMAVIGMGMRENDRRAEARAYAGIQQLHAHVRRGVDQDLRTLVLEQDRGAAAPVPGIGRVALAPVRCR